MATERVGLKAVLEFQAGAAIDEMRRASGTFEQLHKHVEKIKGGVQDMGRGFSGIESTGRKVGEMAQFTIEKFADFAGQMGAVKAVMDPRDYKYFDEMTALAKKMGQETVFTATKAGEAMENLARGGFSARETIAALPAVLNAAAAEGMDLGTAAEIVASNVRTFGFEAKDASRVADVLAYTSAKTASSIISLQEGLKFAAPVARTMNVSFEDTTATLGLLSDVGLKGTLAGTGLKNAMLRIAEGADQGRIAVGNMMVPITMTSRGGIDLKATFLDINKALASMPDPMKRTQAMLELLQLRGMGVTTAFQAMNAEKAADLFENMGKQAAGSAARMQKIRLDNLHGDLILLKSSAELAAASIGEALSGAVSKGLQGKTGLVQLLNDAAAAFDWFGKHKDQVDKTGVSIAGLNQDVTKTVQGMIQGFGAAIETIKSIGSTAYSVAKSIGLVGNEGAVGAAKWRVQLAGVALALTPVIMLLKAGMALTGPFLRVALGGTRVLLSTAGAAGTLIGRIPGAAGALPTLGKVLPKGLGAIGKVATAAEKLTATPVRVVNFDEMPGGLLGGAGGVAGGAADAAKKAAEAMGGGAAPAARTLAGDFKALGSKVAAVATGFAALGGGGGLGALKAGGGVLAAAGVGVGVGMGIDYLVKETTGRSLSDRMAGIGADRTEQNKRDEAAAKGFGVGNNALKQIEMYTNLAERGIKQVQVRGRGGAIETMDLTREAVRSRTIDYMRRQGANDVAISDALKQLELVLAKLPTKEDFKLNVQIDGKTVARATAKNAKETAARRGETPPPGANRAAATE